MQSGSRAGKYFPLQKYLSGLSVSCVTLTFTELEIVLGAPLPDSAYIYPAWWGNNVKGHVHASAWLEAGYLVESLDIGKSVKFVKKNSRNLDHRVNESDKDRLSEEEVVYLRDLSVKMDRLNTYFTNGSVADLSEKSVIEQYEIIKKFRRLIGNIDNDVSFLGSLLIKEYLQKYHSFININMAVKPQGAPGLDIDEETIDGKRVIGELKTTYPYKANDLGGNQRSNFLNDFEKLHKNKADYKYFFVTELKTFEIVRDKYSNYLHGITLVLLPQAIRDSIYVVRYV